MTLKTNQVANKLRNAQFSLNADKHSSHTESQIWGGTGSSDYPAKYPDFKGVFLMTKSGMNSQKSNFWVITEHTIFQYLPLLCAFTTQEINTMLFLIWNRDFPNRNQVTCVYISSPRLSVNKTHCLPELATVNLEIKTNGQIMLKFSDEWASVTEENPLYSKRWKIAAGYFNSEHTFLLF